MLHILWMIIKFILIVLGILLGLLLLCILVLLFCPVRYRAQVEKVREMPVKETKACAVVSWLFHGISVKICLENGQPDLCIRILGIPVNRLVEFIKNRKKASSPGKMSKVAQKEKELEKEVWLETGPSAETTGISEDNLDGFSENAFESQSGLSKDFTTEPDETGLFAPIVGKIKSITNAAVSAVKKVLAFPSVIIDKLRKWTLTIRSICGKIDWWKKLLSHPRTKEAISLVWKDLKKLIRHILPTKMEGTVVLGSEDPAVTGAVLAALGISFPLHKNCVEVTPVFEGENILEGSIRLKGRIYGCIFIKTAIEVYFNKNVKYVIRRWKHKEG